MLYGATAGALFAAGAGDEAVQVGFERAGGRVGPYGGEIRGGLAIEQAEVEEVGVGELFDAARLGFGDERFEPAPVSLAMTDPKIGDQ